jgi:lysophospholipase L1-like esterase
MSPGSAELKLSFKFACLFCVLVFIAGGELHGQDSNFYLRSGDRVVFYGDSITEQAYYTNFIETYIVTRFPKLDVSFANSGWSGDRIYGGPGGTTDERLVRDVLPHKPTVMTVMFGMNDGCYVEFNADCYKGFTEGYERFLGLLRKELPSLRVTLLQPSPFDDWTDSHAWRLAPPVKSGYNNVLVRYSRYVKELAGKNRMNVADMNTPLADLIQEAQKTNREEAQKIIGDRIHPSPAGGLVMAMVLLRSWNAPALVTSVELNGSSRKIVNEQNTKLSGTKFGSEITWTQIDNALPFPVDISDKTSMLAASLSGVADILNRQMLTVTNLKASRYKLKIDGEDIGSFTKDELGKGINLTVHRTPMTRQAAEVHELTRQHNQIHFTRWRSVQVEFGKENLPGVASILGNLDAVEAELVRRQHASAQPKPHRYQLVPIA